MGHKPGAAGGHLATKRGKHEAYPGSMTEKKKKEFLTRALEHPDSQLRSNPFLLGPVGAEFLWLTTLPTSAQMRWHLCAGHRTQDFLDCPCKYDLRQTTSPWDY